MVDYFGIEPFLECYDEQLSDAYIYPNPSSGIINIVLDVEKEGLCFCLIHNQLGQLLMHQDVIFSSAGASLDLSRLPAGSYYLSIFDGRMKKITTKQVIKH
ncbi:MAG: T9SS type A sorting domain-containing protein [Lewinella sp.]